MKVLGNRVFVRITKENRDSIFGKEITREDGSKVRLFLTVDAKEDEDRKAQLFVQTGIIEGVGTGAYHNEDGSFIPVGDVQVGDTAIINYTVCNSNDQIISKDDNGELYHVLATTTYHTKTKVIEADRKNKRDQIAYMKGDYEELSPLLGVLRGDKLIARAPYVFLEHQSNVIKVISKQGLHYQEKHKILKRRILSISKESSEKFYIDESDVIICDDFDLFSVKIGDRTIDCIQDRDVMCRSALLPENK